MANRLWTFGDSIFGRENKPFKLFFQGPGRLSESKVVSTHRTGTHPEQTFTNGLERDSGIPSWRCRGIAERGVRYRGVARNFLGNIAGWKMDPDWVDVFPI